MVGTLQMDWFSWQVCDSVIIEGIIIEGLGVRVV